MSEQPTENDKALAELADDYDAQHELNLRHRAQGHANGMMDVLVSLAHGHEKDLDEDGKKVEVDTTPHVRARAAKDVIDYGLPRGTQTQQELQSALAQGIAVVLVQIAPDGTEGKPEAIDVDFEKISDGDVIEPVEGAPDIGEVLELQVDDLEDAP
jgi:hypothetical protein